MIVAHSAAVPASTTVALRGDWTRFLKLLALWGHEFVEIYPAGPLAGLMFASLYIPGVSLRTEWFPWSVRLCMGLAGKRRMSCCRTRLQSVFPAQKPAISPRNIME